MSSTSRKRSHEDPSPRPRRPLQREVSGTDHLAVLEALNLPVSLITPQYTYKWVNSCYSAAQGKKPEEIIGRTVRDLWGETFDKTIKGHLDRCFQGAEVRAKAWVRYPAHGPRYCEIVYSPYYPGRKGAVYAIVVVYDTSERKKVEERLSQSEQRFRDLSEASLEAIVFIEGGVIADANKALARLFGYEDHELRGRRPTDLIAPEERAGADHRIQTLTEGRYETVGLRKDGSLFPILISSRESRIDGHSRRIAAIRDLTGRKEIDRRLKAYQEHLERLVEERTGELKRSEERFRTIFENATEGIFQIAPDGRCLSINPAFARIHGYDKPDDFMTEVADIERLHVEPERRREYIELLHREGRIRNFEFKIYRRDRTITWVSVNARAVRDESGAVLYREGTVQDISQQKRAETQILVQRNLALDLAAASSLERALVLCLEKALETSDTDCGAIHLRNPVTDDLEMAVQIGLSPELVSRFSRVEAHSEIWSLATKRRNVAFLPAEQVTEATRPYVLKDGIRSAIMVPVFYQGRVIAAMNLGSHRLGSEINPGQPTLQLIAGQLGNIIARIRAAQQLEREIETRRQAEMALEAEHLSLQEANAALRVLLKHREEDKKELEEKISSNVKELVLRYVRMLKETRLDQNQRLLIEIIDKNLDDFLSPFCKKITTFDFTPKEMEVMLLTKEGKTSKQIAQLLNVTMDAINRHRYHIRRKLGLNRSGSNLRSRLMTLS